MHAMKATATPPTASGGVASATAASSAFLSQLGIAFKSIFPQLFVKGTLKRVVEESERLGLVLSSGNSGQRRVELTDAGRTRIRSRGLTTLPPTANTAAAAAVTAAAAAAAAAGNSANELIHRSSSGVLLLSVSPSPSSHASGGSPNRRRSSDAVESWAPPPDSDSDPRSAAAAATTEQDTEAAARGDGDGGGDDGAAGGGGGEDDESDHRHSAGGGSNEQKIIDPSIEARLYASEQPRHLRYMLEFRTRMCDRYATKSCPGDNRRNINPCFDVHQKKNVRRVPRIVRYANGVFFSYNACRCQSIEKEEKCARGGDQCSFSHIKEEIAYHPSRYKTQLCSFPFKSAGNCARYGVHCAFAHGEDDLRKPLILKREHGMMFALPNHSTQTAAAGTGGGTATENGTTAAAADVKSLPYAPTTYTTGSGGGGGNAYQSSPPIMAAVSGSAAAAIPVVAVPAAVAVPVRVNRILPAGSAAAAAAAAALSGVNSAPSSVAAVSASEYESAFPKLNPGANTSAPAAAAVAATTTIGGRVIVPASTAASNGRPATAPVHAHTQSPPHAQTAAAAAAAGSTPAQKQLSPAHGAIKTVRPLIAPEPKPAHSVRPPLLSSLSPSPSPSPSPRHPPVATTATATTPGTTPVGELNRFSLPADHYYHHHNSSNAGSSGGTPLSRSRKGSLDIGTPPLAPTAPIGSGGSLVKPAIRQPSPIQPSPRLSSAATAFNASSLDATNGGGGGGGAAAALFGAPFALYNQPTAGSTTAARAATFSPLALSPSSAASGALLSGSPALVLGGSAVPPHATNSGDSLSPVGWNQSGMSGGPNSSAPLTVHQMSSLLQQTARRNTQLAAENVELKRALHEEQSARRQLHADSQLRIRQLEDEVSRLKTRLAIASGSAEAASPLGSGSTSPLVNGAKATISPPLRAAVAVGPNAAAVRDSKSRTLSEADAQSYDHLTRSGSVAATIGGGSGAGGLFGGFSLPAATHASVGSTTSRASRAGSSGSVLSTDTILSLLRSIVPPSSLTSGATPPPPASSAVAGWSQDTTRAVQRFLWSEVAAAGSSLLSPLASALRTSKNRITDLTVRGSVFDEKESSGGGGDRTNELTRVRWYRVRCAVNAKGTTPLLPPSVDLLLRTYPNFKSESLPDMMWHVSTPAVGTGASSGGVSHPFILPTLHRFQDTFTIPISQLAASPTLCVLSPHVPLSFTRFVAQLQTPLTARQVVAIGLQIVSAISYLYETRAAVPQPLTVRHLLVRGRDPASAAADGNVQVVISPVPVASALPAAALAPNSMYSPPLATAPIASGPVSPRKHAAWNFGLLLHQICTLSSTGSSAGGGGELPYGPNMSESYHPPPLPPSRAAVDSHLDACLQSVIRELLRSDASERLSIDDARLSLERAYFPALMQAYTRGGGSGAGGSSNSSVVNSVSSSLASTPASAAVSASASAVLSLSATSPLAAPALVSHTTGARGISTPPPTGSAASAPPSPVPAFIRFQTDLMVRLTSVLQHRQQQLAAAAASAASGGAASASAVRSPKLTAAISPNAGAPAIVDLVNPLIDDMLLLDALMAGRVTELWSASAAAALQPAAPYGSGVALSAKFSASPFARDSSALGGLFGPSHHAGGGGSVLFGSALLSPSRDEPYVAPGGGGAAAAGRNGAAGGGSTVNVPAVPPITIPQSLSLLGSTRSPPPPSSDPVYTTSPTPSDQHPLTRSVDSLLSDVASE